MKLLLVCIGILLIAVTALSRLRSPAWWIRFTDFPRLQLAFGLALTSAAFIFVADTSSGLDIAFGALLVAAFAYQIRMILPYTPLAPVQVLRAPAGDETRRIRILISNVRMENRNAEDLIALIREESPDLFLAVETDAWWDERLRSLDVAYPHSVRRPQENHYGVHLFSRLPFEDAEVRFLVDGDVPSIRARLRLRSGAPIEFHGIHPRPPLVGQGAEQRDAELMVLGRDVKGHPLPTIIAGDLNDVAWSKSTRLFQRISGMLDPRRGRGLLNSYHAGIPLVRWPLDHVFHDARFLLVRLKRLRNIGSDHFPVLVELAYHPDAEDLHEAPEAKEEDHAEASARIEEGRKVVDGGGAGRPAALAGPSGSSGSGTVACHPARDGS